MSTRRYAVVGTGAIGGYYGAKLASAGFDVWFVARSDADALRQSGLHVSSVDGDIELPVVQVVDDPADAPPVDVVLLTIKATGNASLATLLHPLVRAGTIVVVMQNGFGVDAEVAAVVPEATVLGGMCFICSTRVAPGRIEHLDFGRITVGEHRSDATPAGITDAVHAIVDDLQSAGVEAATRTDLVSARWQKLVWNMPFNGLSVALDAGTDALMSDPGTRALAASLMGEVEAVAEAHGHPIGDGFIDRMLANTEAMTPYATSMKLDFDAHRPLELPTIYDAPLEVAAALGVATPGLSALAAQLHFLDARNLLRSTDS